MAGDVSFAEILNGLRLLGPVRVTIYSFQLSTPSMRRGNTSIGCSLMAAVTVPLLVTAVFICDGRSDTDYRGGKVLLEAIIRETNRGD